MEGLGSKLSAGRPDRSPSLPLQRAQSITASHRSTSSPLALLCCFTPTPPCLTLSCLAPQKKMPRTPHSERRHLLHEHPLQLLQRLPAYAQLRQASRPPKPTADRPNIEATPEAMAVATGCLANHPQRAGLLSEHMQIISKSASNPLHLKTQMPKSVQPLESAGTFPFANTCVCVCP